MPWPDLLPASPTLSCSLPYNYVSVTGLASKLITSRKPAWITKCHMILLPGNVSFLTQGHGETERVYLPSGTPLTPQGIPF